jgi:hypothetical protein
LTLDFTKVERRPRIPMGQSLLGVRARVDSPLTFC